MTVEIRGKHLRIRLFNPKLCKVNTFRTHDIGRKGGSKRISCVRKDTGKWDTQAVIFEIDALRRGRKSTWRTLNNILERLSYEERAKVLKLIGKAI